MTATAATAPTAPWKILGRQFSGARRAVRDAMGWLGKQFSGARRAGRDAMGGLGDSFLELGGRSVTQWVAWETVFWSSEGGP